MNGVRYPDGLGEEIALLIVLRLFIPPGRRLSRASFFSRPDHRST